MSSIDNDLEVVDFGQVEPLTVRLSGLIRSYPRGAGIFKEFIQNADDAGAESVRFVIDHNTYPLLANADPVERIWAGPALLVSNDASFTTRDFEGIQRIGASVKAEESWKAGRFGLGFNASYNLTDYPTLISADRFVFFDPHQRHRWVRGQRPGGALHLGELRQRRPDLLAPFAVAGAQEANVHDGTIFRLPLRLPGQQPSSDITDEPCPPEVLRQIAELFATFADEAVLFLKSVQRIEVIEQRHSDSAAETLLCIETLNPTEVKASRERVNAFVRRDYADILQDVRAGESRCPSVVYQHRVRVSGTLRSSLVTWQVISRISGHNSDKVATSMDRMHSFGEKAVPWVGVAARVDKSAEVAAPATVEGRLFCFLPLPGTSGLPVHVHGYLDLDSSRTAPFLDPETTGHPAARRQWNQTLATEVVADAYADLLEHLARHFAPAYDLWPDLSSLGTFAGLIATATYNRLWFRQCIACVGPASPLACGPDVLVPPPSRPKLQEPLAAIGRLSVPDPVIPPHVVAGFAAADQELLRLSPQDVREALRVDEDLAVALEAAPNPATRRREWVTELLRLCLSDRKHADLAGVPLLLLEDGLLHAFGRTADAVHLGADERARRIFSSRPVWFVDSDFAAETGLPEVASLNLFALTPHRAALLVARVLQDAGPPVGISTHAAIPQASEWLVGALRYLTSHQFELSPHIAACFRGVPMIPDENGVLQPAGRPSTPFVLPEELQHKESLLHAIHVCGLKWAVTGAPLLDALRDFASAFVHAGLVRWLTGPNLLTALQDRDAADALPPRYDAAIHNELLNFLFDDRWARHYGEPHVEIFKQLRIFPTTEGRLVRVNEPGVYFPTDFRAPDELGLNVTLLQKGDRGQWGSQLRQLASTRLDFATFVESVLLPAYSTFDPARQLRAFAWLRDSLSGPGVGADASKVMSLLSSAELVSGNDGRLYRADRLYDPTLEVVRAVLGTTARFPDPSTYGVDGEQFNQWAMFLNQLGLQRAPSGEDILRCIDSFNSEGPNNAARLSDVILQHVDEHWDAQFGQLMVEDPKNGEETPFATALSQRHWIRAIVNPEILTSYFAARVPENRMYKPGEIYARAGARLVCSQAPIAAIGKKVNRAMLDAIGVPLRPPIELVHEHFDRVRAEWLAQHSGSAVATDHAAVPNALKQTLKAIYTYFGRLDGATADHEGEVDDEDDVEISDNESSAAARDDIMTKYRDIPCLWDAETRTFRLPRHVFAVNVTYMEPRRRQLLVNGAPRADAGYRILGRRQEPDSTDICEWLQELHNALSGSTVVEPILGNILRGYARLEQLLDEAPRVVIRELPVLTERGTLRTSSTTLISDAPWFKGKFVGDDAFLLHPRVSVNLASRVGMGRMSARIDERLAAPPERAIHPDAVRDVERLQTLFRSAHFARGLLRIALARRSEGAEPPPGLEWLESANIVPAIELTTELSLTLEEGAPLQAAGDAPFWIAQDGHTIFVTVRRRKFWDNDLAQAIGRRMQEPALDLLVLSCVLRVSPTDVATTLDAQRVPPLLDESPTFEAAVAQSNGLNAAIDFGEDDSDDGSDASGADPSVDFDASDAITGEVDQPMPTAEMAIGEGNAVTAVDDDPSDTEIMREVEDRAPAAGNPTPAHPLWRPPSGDYAGPRHDLLRAHPNRDFPPGARGTRSSSSVPGVARTPGLGHAATSGGSPGQRRKVPPLRRGRAISYVVPDGSNVPEDRDIANDEQPVNMAVSRAAVRAVMDFERKHGRHPFEEAHNNPGYDVISRSSTGERYIEVKGIDGGWSEAGVPLSPKQFDHARKLSHRFWVYVVEYAREPWRAVIHCIQDPVSRVTQFRFDSGWHEFAEHYEVEDERRTEVIATRGLKHAEPPTEGEVVELPEGGTGVVETVRAGGVVVTVRVRKLPDGPSRPYRFDLHSGKLMPRQ